MSTQLRASLLLQLDGQGKLNDGLAKFQKQLEQLRDIAKTLGLTELEDGLDQLRGSSGTVDALTDGLRGVERQADRTGAAIKRLVQAANDNIIRVNSQGGAFGSGSRGALMVIPGAAGGGGRGGGGAVDAAYGAPLLLTGPGGDGGIPINLRGPNGLVGAGRGLLGAGRGIVRATDKFGEAANNATGGIMSSAMEGFAVYEPIKAYAGFENILRHIAITEKLQGAAVDVEIKRLASMFNADALSTGQTSESIATAYSDLVQMGIRRGQADETIGVHSHAATAYNISAEAMGPAVGALLQNMKIKGGDLGGALAAMAYASKEGRFKVEDFSRQLPGTAGYLSALGMKGRHSADIGFAALETVMKNASEPNQAAADFNDAMAYITAPVANRSFAKQGIDLPKLLENGSKAGINPLDAVLGKLDQKTRGMDPIAAAEYLHKLLHNQQAAMAILSLLQHKQDFLDLRKTLDGVGQKTLDTDFATAFAATSVQMRKLGEQAEQLNRTFGEGFAPDLKIVGTLLGGLLSPLTWLNSNFPNITHGVLATAGGFLLLAAGIGIFKVVLPLLVGAWGLLTSVLTAFGAALEFVVALFTVVLSPIGLIVAAVVAAVAGIGAAAYEIYKHWETIGPFFEKLWEDAKGIFNGFLTWVVDWASRIGGIIMHGIAAGFHDGVNGSINLLEHLAPAGSGFERFLEHEKLPQLQPPGAGGAQSLVDGPQHTIGGVITVQAAPGTAITGAQGSNPRVPLVVSQAPNAGPVLSRH